MYLCGRFSSYWFFFIYLFLFIFQFLSYSRSFSLIFLFVSFYVFSILQSSIQFLCFYLHPLFFTLPFWPFPLCFLYFPIRFTFPSSSLLPSSPFPPSFLLLQFPFSPPSSRFFFLIFFLFRPLLSSSYFPSPSFSFPPSLNPPSSYFLSPTISLLTQEKTWIAIDKMARKIYKYKWIYNIETRHFLLLFCEFIHTHSYIA